MIVDDEPLARALLRQLLEAQRVTVVGEAEEAEEALASTQEHQPDVVFLDIRMPGIDGIELTGLLAEQEPPPLVVLVTGYSEHAVKAYEKDALDYILKPVSQERLETSLAKIRKQLSLRRRAIRPRSLQRLPIKIENSFRIVPTESILFAMSRSKSVTIKTRTAEFKTNYTLTYLESVLPGQFMRVHASCIVNLSAIEELLVLGNHTYGLKLASAIELPVGRQQYPKLQERLGFPV